MLADYQAALLSQLAVPGARPRASVGQLLAAHLAWIEHDRSCAWLWLNLPPCLMTQAGGASAASRAVAAAVDRWANPLIASGKLRPMPAGMLPAMLFGPADRLCQSWLEGDGKDSLADMAPALADTAWAAIKGSPAAVRRAANAAQVSML
jgi:hypothetical protein